MKKVLFVCMGNICRSPTAEAVFRHQIKQAGVEQQWVVDSAGTHAYHVGNAPDKRSQTAAQTRGYAMQSLRARQIEASDFDRFDWILAMDQQNLQGLQQCQPPGSSAQLALMMDFAESPKWQGNDVPDPYYGDGDGFAEVLDRVEISCAGFLAHAMATKGS